ncbi:MAG: hypothetical protein ACC628_18755 [Pirellulaceae bacterium]
MARFIPAYMVALSALVAVHLISQGIGGIAVSPQQVAAPNPPHQEDNDSPAGDSAGESQVLPVAHFAPVPQPLPAANASRDRFYTGPALLRRVPPVEPVPVADHSGRVSRSAQAVPQPFQVPYLQPPAARWVVAPPMGVVRHLPSVPAAAPLNPPTPLDWLNQTSLAAVATQADAVMARAFALAEKGALYSARSELERALRLVGQAVDASSRTSRHSQLLKEGFQALKEADDFLGKRRSLDAGIDVRAIVATHRTPVLKGRDVSQTPAVVAMQHYYTFAQERMARAASGAPPASRLLYGLGKIHVAISEQNSSTATMHGPKAMAFHRAALMVDPTNYRAANELGVLLARFGQLEEARSVLQHSATMRPVAETWHNLSKVHERLGETNLAQRARYELSLAQQRTVTASGATGSSLVQWVDPRTFSTMGYVGAPESVPAHAAPPKTAEKPSPFWTW